ncbi:hypothetical protein Aperf_G00000029053 [Anoplocephala perfoliata]
MTFNALIPYSHEHGTNSNGNIAFSALGYDENKLLLYREIFCDGFSTVIAARDLTSGGAVAIKKVEFDYLKNIFAPIKQLRRIFLDKTVKQTSRIRALSNLAMTKIIDFVSVPHRLIILSEMCLFGDLFNWMLQQHVVRFRDVMIMLHSLFKAFNFLHEEGYSHGYLKPTNVLFQTISPHSVLISPDLSVKREMAYLLKEPLITCQSCTAPEALEELVESVNDEKPRNWSKLRDFKFFGTKEMDIWSIGVIALLAITGVNFFQFNTIDDLKQPVEKKLERAFSHPIIQMCSKQLVVCLRKVLTIDPRYRITAAAGSAINWVEEAKVANDERNLLYMMEHDLLNSCRYYRIYGQMVLDDLLENSQTTSVGKLSATSTRLSL